VDEAARVRALLALARASQGDAALVNRAWDARAKLPAWSQAQLAETIARMNPKDGRAKKLLASLATQAKIESGRAWITEPAGPWASLWFGDETPTSALLRAMLVADPENVLVPRLAGGLVQARQGGRWSNTWTTAESMAALADYAARYESGTVRTEVATSGKALLTADLGKRGLAQAHLAQADLVAGPLTVKSTNGGRVYYEARVSWADPSQPARDEGFTLLRKVEVLDGAGPNGALASGARVRVTLQVATPQPRFDVALVDQLPAGLEAIDGTLATTSMQDLADERGGNDAGYGFGRRQLNDASVAWYGSYLPPGVQTVSYLARATTPGTYVLPGATIEEMYHPEVHGRTASGSVVVLPRAPAAK
jgi:uncharacterized protein YfaS (alpha-2-macroglobulin family)